MNKILSGAFTTLIRPLVGSGIGNYFPFKQLHGIYVHVSKGKTIIKQTIYGFNMKLESGKLIDDTIKFRGAWEEGISKIIYDTLVPGDTFVDIGANIGYYTLLAAGKAGNTGKVIAFEPSTINYQRLIYNISLNKFNNIALHKLGVGDAQASFEIHYDDNNPGATSLVSSVRNDGFPVETIEVIVLDDYLKEEPKIDFIKMDIEGFEYEAIVGMKGILNKQPKIKLLFEFSPVLYAYKVDNIKEYSIRILSFLQEIGFNLYHIHENGSYAIIGELDKYYETIMNGKNGQSDIFCIKE